MRIETVLRKGTGSYDNPFEPETTAKHWQVIDETEDSFVIEIYDDEGNVEIVEDGVPE